MLRLAIQHPQAMPAGEDDDLDAGDALLESDFDPQITLFAAKDAAGVLGTLRWLAWGLLGVGLVAVLVMAFTLTAVVKAGLRPIDELADSIQCIDADDLAVLLFC